MKDQPRLTTYLHTIKFMMIVQLGNKASIFLKVVGERPTKFFH
jgi:hypothetical protein